MLYSKHRNKITVQYVKLCEAIPAQPDAEREREITSHSEGLFEGQFFIRAGRFQRLLHKNCLIAGTGRDWRNIRNLWEIHDWSNNHLTHATRVAVSHRGVIIPNMHVIYSNLTQPMGVHQRGN